MIGFPPVLPRKRLARSSVLLAFLCGVGAALAQEPAADVGRTLNPSEVGSGELLFRGPEGLAPLPILGIDVKLDVTGMLVRGVVTQRFQNSTHRVIEAQYVFPLPERAAVHHMEMRIGERKIVSVIQEKEEARRAYDAAREEGRKAALVEQWRPNLFTMAAANINPGEIVEVRLEYLQELSYDDGGFAVVFPLTFVPRYDASGPPVRPDVQTSADPSPGAVPAPLAAVPLARVTARVQPGFPLEGGDVFSPSHEVESWWDDDGLVVETLHPRIPADRDFRLEWRPLRGLEPRSAVFVEDRDDGRYLLLMLLPPLEEVGPGQGLATETLFIIDISRSMAGPSIARAREALIAALDRLRPGDTFNILTFNEEVQAYDEGFLPAGEPEILDAQAWVGRLRTAGGTRIDRALEFGVAMTNGGATGRLQRIVFLTDGGVNNEEDILAGIRDRLGPVRLHALGIGAAPNRWLLREMARLGRGLCRFIADAGTVHNKVDTFLARLDRPVMTDLGLGWDGPAEAEIYPTPLPDLHAGEPLFASMRFPPGAAIERVFLDGRVLDGPLHLEADLEATRSGSSGVGVRWARARVGALIDGIHAGADPAQVRGEVVATSKQFGIVTRFTSLIAVEAFPTAVDGPARVQVPNAPPGGSLPRGGTAGPLWIRIGAVLSVAGAGLLILAWRWE